MTTKFILGPEEEYRLIRDIKRIVDKIGKLLFLDELGDMDPRNAVHGGFSDNMLRYIINLDVPYAAIWGWEFYIKNTYTSYNIKTGKVSSLEPGHTDYVIVRFRQTASLLGAHEQAPPISSLTWPIECAIVSGVQKVFAVASDGGNAVEKVTFLANGEVLATKTIPPYELSWDVKNMSPGEYTLTAQAYTRAGNHVEYVTPALVNTRAETGTYAEQAISYIHS